MPSNNAVAPIQHVFVLMLENRSFDHMLGFSALQGINAENGKVTQINGLTGMEFNTATGIDYKVTKPADWSMPTDPSHEFTNVLLQLCGTGAIYPPNGVYPAINSGGFVLDYVASGGTDPREIMKCYDPSQLPVLVALAREFAVCDRWHCSLPGPTWPNRFFLHAASSGGLDHSPSIGEISFWETLSGFQFERGTIFDALNNLNIDHAWRIYSGGDFPNVAALKGINNFQVRDLDDFAADVASASYSSLYTFIEPNYGNVVDNTFRGGNSQHPLDDVTQGELLIKSVYEAIRNSPVWDTSLLVVTWDEHGGFYDHVAPPPAVSPGDQTVTNGANQFGFNFQTYGPRVPAVVVSPLIPQNTIDHRLYDHASVAATLEALFNFKPLTDRDAQANNLIALASLRAPRTDARTTLPDPASAITLPAPLSAPPMAMLAAPTVPTASVDAGNLPGFLHAALRSDLALSKPAERQQILAHFRSIKTRTDAQQYMDQVRIKVRASRAAIKNQAGR